MLLAVVVVVVLANSVPLALLPVYQDELALGPVAVALVAALPTGGIAAALLLGGRASDAVGRRPVLLLAVTTAAVGVLALLLAETLPPLLAGRVLVGAGVGLATTAGTAALLDLAAPDERRRAAVLAAAAAVGGIAAGPALGGLVVQHLPLPRQLALLVELAQLGLAAAGLTRLAETVPGGDRSSLRAALRPRLPRTPARLRGVARVAALAVVPAWAVMGLMLSSGPGLLTGRLGLSDRSAVAGLLALFLASSATAQLGLRTWSARRAAVTGLTLLPTGLASLVVAVDRGSVSGYAVAALLVGTGHGLTQLSAQSALAVAATPAERGPAFGALLLVTYAAAGATAIAFGVTAEEFGVVDAVDVVAAGTGVLALVALVVTVRSSVMTSAPCAGSVLEPCP